VSRCPGALVERAASVRRRQVIVDDLSAGRSPVVQGHAHASAGPLSAGVDLPVGSVGDLEVCAGWSQPQACPAAWVVVCCLGYFTGVGCRATWRATFEDQRAHPQDTPPNGRSTGSLTSWGIMCEMFGQEPDVVGGACATRSARSRRHERLLARPASGRTAGGKQGLIAEHHVGGARHRGAPALARAQLR
jgi:hypothetical protein